MDTLKLSDLPQVDELLAEKSLSLWIERLSRPFVKNVITDTLNRIRSVVLKEGGSVPLPEEILNIIEKNCRKIERTRLQRVVNGTGVFLHTNLGRVPLSAWTWREAERVNTGFSNIEIDLETGKRGGRFPFLLEHIRRLTGAEDALLVNNNASGLFLALSALVGENEVLISRGELVQIGDGFRIPDILRQSGARLVEVGTTNITTSQDFSRAVTENTRMLLTVNPSNYRIRGFESKPSIEERRSVLPPGVILAVDEGSGQMENSSSSLSISVKSYIKKGADLVAFSCDKMFGGPQGGFVVGKAKYIQAMKAHPLMRLFRVGKTIASLMEAHLMMICGEGKFSQTLPLSAKELNALKIRGQNLQKKFPRFCELVSSACAYGGGSHPDEDYPSYALSLQIDGESPETLLEKLRKTSPPVVGVIRNGRVLVDLSTVAREEINWLERALQNVSSIKDTDN